MRITLFSLMETISWLLAECDGWSRIEPRSVATGPVHRRLFGISEGGFYFVCHSLAAIFIV